MSDVQDWPLSLRRNAAICDLAKALFKARAEVYGGNPDLTAAPTHVRARFILIAEAHLTALAPNDEPTRVVVTGLQGDDKVIGQISPKGAA